MKISFSKYQGAGNDFILIDDRSADFPIEKEKLIRFLCHRSYGIGADGVILLQTSKTADYRMRIFNADGYEVEMCGNGIRCLVHFIYFLEKHQKSYKIQTQEGCYIGQIEKDKVSIIMPTPKILEQEIRLSLSDQTLNAILVDSGVPHVVIEMADINEVDVLALGREIRFHQRFSPKGANANFFQVTSKGKISLRTYERGVEAETLACGTGALAVAAVLKEIRSQSRFTIFPRSQHPLQFQFDDHASQVTMTGPAVLVFNGQINIRPLV